MYDSPHQIDGVVVPDNKDVFRKRPLTFNAVKNTIELW